MRTAENINEDSSHDALNHGDHGHRKPVPTPKKRMRRLSVNQLFDLLDADGDGTLVLSEVVDAANKLGVTQEEAAHLFHDLDKDGSGTLTRDELSTIESFSHYFSKGPRFSLTRRSSGSSIPGADLCKDECISVLCFQSSIVFLMPGTALIK